MTGLGFRVSASTSPENVTAGWSSGFCGSEDPAGTEQTVKGEKACKDRALLRMLHGEDGSYLALLWGGVWSIVAAAPQLRQLRESGVRLVLRTR